MIPIMLGITTATVGRILIAVLAGVIVGAGIKDKMDAQKMDEVKNEVERIKEKIRRKKGGEK